MMTTILPCPFCDYADVEICEVEPGRFAIDCPECECIGPFADSIEDAAARWNKAHDKNLSLAHEVQKINEWDRAGRDSQRKKWTLEDEFDAIERE